MVYGIYKNNERVRTPPRLTISPTSMTFWICSLVPAVMFEIVQQVSLRMAFFVVVVLTNRWWRHWSTPASSMWSV